MRLRFLIPMGLAACSGSDATTTQNTAVASTSALSEAADTSSALELQGLLDLARAPERLRDPSPGALRCDDTPEVTNITVCGKEIPGTAHYEWADCAAKEGRGAPGNGAPPPDGTGPAARGPSGGSGDRHGGPGGPGDERRGGPGGGRGEDRAGGFANSSGTVDLKVTASAPDTCDDTTQVTYNQEAAFDVTHSAQDGSKGSVKGSSQSTSVRTQASRHSITNTRNFDVTQTRTDAAGAVVHSLHLNGNTSSANDDAAKTRTINGAFTFEESKDGTASSGSITLEGLVRVPPDTCFWPTAGKITKTSGDATQTLEFSSTCGSATLDGESVDLTSLVPEKRADARGEKPPRRQ